MENKYIITIFMALLLGLSAKADSLTKRSDIKPQVSKSALTPQGYIDIHSSTKSTINQDIFKNRGFRKMKVKLGPYSFRLQDDWEDTSNYIYKTIDKKKSLTVSFSTTNETISLDELVIRHRQQLTDTMGNNVEFLSQEQVKISSLPAIQLSSKFGDQGQKYLEYWASAYYGKNKYVTISYVGSWEDESLSLIFKHILTFCLLGSQPETKAEVNYVWRQADFIHFQVPTELIPPRFYTYLSPAGIKLKMSLYNSSDRLPSESVKDEATKDLRFGGTMGKIQNDFFKNLSIQQLDYTFKSGDPLDLKLFKGHRAHVSGYGGHLFLFIKGFEHQSEQIDEFWQGLIVSLIDEK